MDIQERIDSYFNDSAVRGELISAISRLVAVKSVKGEPTAEAPFGPGPRAALDEAVKLCAELGFSVRDYDHYVGLADMNDKDTQLHILAHLDVVGEGSGWSTDPYTCVEKDGVLYGRGVSDDKGPLCAALFAMKAVRDLGLPVTKNARLIMGTDEESGSGDIKYYYAREPYAPQSFSPDADFPLINVEKGQFRPVFGASWPAVMVEPRVSVLSGGFRFNVVPPEASAEVLGLRAADITPLCPTVERMSGAMFTVTDMVGGARIHCTGKNAHAASPDDGVNAIQAMLELLSALPLAQCQSTRAIRALKERFPLGDTRGKALGIAQKDDSGELTVNLALMTLSETGFSAQFDARVPVCATVENCVQVCEKALGEAGFTLTGGAQMVPAHVVAADTPLVKTLLECYSAYTGVRDPKPMAIGGGTYVHDIPGGVAFGCDFPGFDPKMHSANEQASVDNLIKSAKIFALAIARLCR
ncbi:Sapep family Mn(2+)-dependent dipeptidase [Vermiculatibacterium agrestimuris]|uniref:Sapep family Mn(2+)-dependent dipeptidase n=1 Tax=Vermiculatibacterium agrestimuris TaxID=2941519 RepID=UPI00203E4746|nr:Sapep family Mn(2+)-dependent dipeptidase [Vermiculatibacterium agrestimuris]